ncbi:MAG TPA: hypothetical protein VME43_14390 [Bryobacteraceae bacterium]|nr:hypothetical protein [Bryobacteraceae bacterium]
MFPHLRPLPAGLIWLTLAAAPALHADVTLHYQTVVELNPNLPPQLTGQMMKSMNVNLPKNEIVQLKNGRMFYSSGNLVSIADFTKHEITLLDPAGKRYATIPADRYADEMARAMPPMNAQSKAAMASMKGHSESRATGRTDTIQGVEGEEHEVTISVDSAGMPNVPAGPMMRMVMHLWTAKAGEAARVPAIGELTRYDLLSFGGADPVSTMSKAFEQIPGFADTFSAFLKGLRSGGSPVILRVQMEMFLPMLTALMQQMPAGSTPAGGFDAAGALAHITHEVSSISTDPIADSVYQIPEGYQAVPAADILKDIMRSRTAVQ